MSSTAFAAGLTPTEQADPVAAVVLNKVQNLEWTYFQVRLRRQFEVNLNDQRPNMQLLARIEAHPIDNRSRRYKWVGTPVSYTHLRAHETPEQLVCRLLLEKKKL